MARACGSGPGVVIRNENSDIGPSGSAASAASMPPSADTATSMATSTRTSRADARRPAQGRARPVSTAMVSRPAAAPHA